MTLVIQDWTGQHFYYDDWDNVSLEAEVDFSSLVAL
jgi:hypothetical protein